MNVRNGKIQSPFKVINGNQQNQQISQAKQVKNNQNEMIDHFAPQMPNNVNVLQPDTTYSTSLTGPINLGMYGPVGSAGWQFRKVYYSKPRQTFPIPETPINYLNFSSSNNDDLLSSQPLTYPHQLYPAKIPWANETGSECSLGCGAFGTCVDNFCQMKQVPKKTVFGINLTE